MARQPNTSRDAENPLPAALMTEARGLASEYKGLTIRDAKACLSRLVASVESHYGRNLGPQLAFNEFPLCLFADALVFLSKSKAIQLILQEDLSALFRRIQTVEYLFREDVPFLTKEELISNIRDFISFLSVHQAYIIKTGLPPMCFRQCRWLYVHLGRLYDTRRTGSPYPLDELSSGKWPGQPPYRFIQMPKSKVLFLTDIKYCEYESADLLGCMNEADAVRIERDRGRLLSIKRRLLEKLTGGPRTDSVWQECLAELAKDLNADDVQFYLRMDRIYLGGQTRLGQDEAWSPKMSPGGLTNLFEVIGRVEVEHRIGTFDRMKKASNGMLPTLLQIQPDEEYLLRWRYFKAIDHPDRHAIDAAIDEMSSRLASEMSFWDEFRSDLQVALEKRFRIPLPIIEVKGEHTEIIGTILRYQAAILAEKIDRGELLIPLPMEQEDMCFFRRRGSEWEVKFKGEPLHAFNDLDGLFYLHVLLSAPGKRFFPTQLREARARDKAADCSKFANATFSAEGGVGTFTDTGEKTDAEGLADYKDKLAELERDICKADANKDHAELKRLREEHTFLKQHIKSVTGLGGKGTKMSSTAKNDRDAVLKALHTARNSIQKKSPALFLHFQKSVPENDFLHYEPDSEVVWFG